VDGGNRNDHRIGWIKVGLDSYIDLDAQS